MKYVSKSICILLSIIFFISFSACTNGYSSFDTDAFSSAVHIETYSKKLDDKTKNTIKNYLLSLENEFSLSKDSSITYKLKNASINEQIAITSLEQEIFALSNEYYNFSNGKFNHLVYPLSHIWGFSENGKALGFVPPTKDKIDNILNSGVLNPANIVIENGKVYKTNDSVADFGGILKGYAVSKIADILRENGFTDGYVNCGSSSIGILSVSSLSIRHPRENDKSIISIDISDVKNINVSSSGDYEKYQVYNGEKFSHIIDTTTGYPQNTGVISATILTENGAFADAISTALCLMNYSTINPENSELVLFINKILSSYPNSIVFAFYNDGENKTVITNKKQGDFTLLDDSYSICTI